jgi:predicted GNAT family N-acyltransferase
VDLALTRCSELDPHIAAVSVNAAVSAVSTYQRLGFKTIDSVQQRNGITFVPMIRLL